MSGHQLRKAGVYFDAVRVSGDYGRQAADTLAGLTGGCPGPVIQEASGEPHTYFLVAPGSTGHRRWPPGAYRLTGERDCYVGVPALYGPTWPLSWRCPPTADGHLVHTLLLHSTLLSVPAGAVTGPFARDSAGGLVAD